LTLDQRGFKALDAYTGYGNHYVHIRVKIPTRYGSWAQGDQLSL
jgi:hypothetical protein